MKKKLIPRQNGSQANDDRDDTSYEELRAAVLEGTLCHADKAHDLAIVVTQGMCAWFRQNHGTQRRNTQSAASVRPYGRFRADEYLATLIANLAEQGWRAVAGNAGNEKN